MRIKIVLLFSIVYFLITNQVISSALPKESEIDMNVDSKEFAVTFFPIGTLESGIIQLENNHTILINGVTVEKEKELNKYLSQYGITSIQTLLITKPLDLKESALASVCETYDIKSILISQKNYSYVKDLLSSLSVEYLDMDMSLSLADGISIKNLYENDKGMNFLIGSREHQLLWLTSLNKVGETVHLTQPLSGVDVVKFPRDRQSHITNQFFTHLDPQTAVLIQNNDKKLDEELLENIHEYWVDVYYTGQHGLISIKFAESQYEVLTFPVKSPQ